MFDWLKKKRPDFDDQWLDIKDFPDRERRYLITDGIEVTNQYQPEFNKNGDIVFYDDNFEKRKATHWMRYPKPPRRK
jgi:hypothetical protein